jgi:hypothetical protein
MRKNSCNGPWKIIRRLILSAIYLLVANLIEHAKWSVISPGMERSLENCNPHYTLVQV